jgi:hypothetical protein
MYGKLFISSSLVIFMLLKIKGMKKIRLTVWCICLLLVAGFKGQAQVVSGVPMAGNEYGTNDDQIPAAPDGKFTIVVNPALKPQNFISFYEHYKRTQAIKPDTTAFSLIVKGWKTMPATQKLEIINREKLHNAQLADSAHRVNNTGDKQLVYFINNTNENVYLQMQDWQFLGVVEGLDKNNQWRPIQYWRFSLCGNSYLARPVKAHSTVVFIAPAINKGDYKTRLRYRVFGLDGFKYSNEFEASINYSDFGNGAPPQQEIMAFKTKSLSTVDIPLTLDLR